MYYGKHIKNSLGLVNYDTHINNRIKICGIFTHCNSSQKRYKMYLHATTWINLTKINAKRNKTIQRKCILYDSISKS